MEEIIFEDPIPKDTFSWKDFPKLIFYRRMLIILFIKCCAEEVIRNGKLLQKRRCMACDYDHPSERRSHIAHGECDLSLIVSSHYNVLLLKLYRETEEKVCKHFRKICLERDISEQIMAEFIKELEINYTTNADGMNGAI